jgi:hypothetical protein
VVDVTQIEIDDVEVDMARPGENLNIFVKGEPARVRVSRTARSSTGRVWQALRRMMLSTARCSAPCRTRRQRCALTRLLVVFSRTRV